MRRRASAILGWMLSAGAVLSAQNWPSFRGPAACGVADGAPTPVTWNAATGENVLWRTPVPGIAVSSPIVWGERVFVSTAVSSDASAAIRTGLYGDVAPSKDVSPHTWKLMALDRRNGKVLWERSNAELAETAEQPERARRRAVAS